MVSGFFGALSPALQAAGASLMGGGDLSQMGTLMPRFQTAQSQGELRRLQMQRAQQAIAETERQRAQDTALMEAVRGGQGVFGRLSEGQRAAITPAIARQVAAKGLERSLFPAVETPAQRATRELAEARRAKVEAETAALGQPGKEEPPAGFRFSADGRRLEPIAGGPKDPTRTKEFRDQARIFGRLSRDLTAYRNAVKQGRNRLSISNRRRLGRLHTNVLLQLKNLEELGVLAGPDLGLLQSQLLDPTAMTTDDDSLIEGIDALQNRVAADTEQFRRTFGATRQQLGFKPLNPISPPVQMQTSAGTNKGNPLTTTGNQPGQRVNPPQGSSLAAGSGSLDAAAARMAEGDFVTDRVTGQRYQKVNGQLVPVDPTDAFAGFGAGGGA